MTELLRGVPPEGGPRADALRDALERITEASMECSGLPNKWGEMLNAVVDAARALGAGTREEEPPHERGVSAVPPTEEPNDT